MSNKQPLVSVVTACFNAEKFVRAMMKSVALQMYTNWELVIVDDCSTDHSYEIIKAYAKELKIQDRVIVLEHGKNRGYGWTLRKAVDNAKGELIAVLDADDAIYPHALETSVKHHLKYPGVALTYSNYVECDANLKEVKAYDTRQLRATQKYIDTKIRINHLKVFKRSLYDHTAGVNKKLLRTVDKDLVLKLEEVGELRHINEYLYLYRKHDSNISRTDHKKSPQYQEKIAQARHGIYKEARKRRLQSTTWLSPEKCIALQIKWGDYDQFITKPNNVTKIEVIKNLRKIIKSCDNKPSILEVGCGAGHFLWTIKESVSEVIGLDFAPTMCILATDQLSKFKVKSEFVQGSCWDLPFPDNHVDIAYQVDVCMHIGGSWKAIEEMVRVAKKYVIFTGPSFETKLAGGIEEKFLMGKRWKVSIHHLTQKLNKLKKLGKLKSFDFKYRPPTDVYKHKILVIEKGEIK